MGWQPFKMGFINRVRRVSIFLGLILVFSVPICHGTTDPRDVNAINSLYAALGFPILPGWVPVGGDPCADGWQGVQCVNANVTGIVLNDVNLGGQLNDDLGQFTSIIQIDMSNNHIGGSIPSNLPVTIRSLFLAGNQFTGSIPDTLLTLGQLSDLDLSGNSLSGQLPPSMWNLSSLTTLRGGNPFNTTVIPSPPAFSPLPLSMAPSPELTPGNRAFGPSVPTITNSSPGGKCWKGSQPASKMAKRHEMGAYNDHKEKPKNDEPFPKLYFPTEKGHKDTGFKPAVRFGNDHERSSLRFTPEAEQEGINRMAAISKHKEDHEIDMTGLDVDILPPPPPPPFFSIDEVTMTPILSPRLPTKTLKSIRSFTIASLQQYTNSFSQENFIGGGMLGSVYRAEILTEKLLAVKKLNTAACRKHSNEDFLDLVSSISKLQHPNVVELVGYCAEHGLQLLVYEYCGNGTLHEALHLDDEIHKKLSWNTRIRLALGAARALEYLHEVCNPPIVHQNFKSANILLDDELEACVSDCGLARLLSSVSLNQLFIDLVLTSVHLSVIRSQPRGEQFLVRWAIPQLHDIDSLSRMVDPSLNGAYPSKSLSRFADIISLCLQVSFSIPTAYCLC
ncbi:STRUBBELIG-receptor family 3 [Actinidia rufa]|uniref:non-specific serine/threonine protein kinase n=1 Tax=Actinidia rufa TaxID=165716 RepID=A0A7J0EZH1_9ERIC|nr:STRUBBELIG-receptor family 3 [Actinidia rufa]